MIGPASNTYAKRMLRREMLDSFRRGQKTDGFEAVAFVGLGVVLLLTLAANQSIGR